MKLKNIALVIVLISVIAISFGGWVANANANYGLNINNSYSETYNKLSFMENESSTIAGKVRGGEIDDATAFETLSIAGFSAIKLSFTSIGTLVSIVTNISRDIGLPYWAVVSFIIFLTVGVAYAILSYIFRWNG